MCYKPIDADAIIIAWSYWICMHHVIAIPIDTLKQNCDSIVIAIRYIHP